MIDERKLHIEHLAELIVDLAQIDAKHKEDVKKYVMTSVDDVSNLAVTTIAPDLDAVNTLPLELLVIKELDLDRVKFVGAPVTEIDDRSYQVQTVQLNVNVPNIDELPCDMLKREMEQMAVRKTIDLIEKYIRDGKTVYVYKLFLELTKPEKTLWNVQHRLFTVDGSVTL